jgi:hypothetical protein
MWGCLFGGNILYGIISFWIFLDRKFPARTFSKENFHSCLIYENKDILKIEKPSLQSKFFSRQNFLLFFQNTKEIFGGEKTTTEKLC